MLKEAPEQLIVGLAEILGAQVASALMVQLQLPAGVASSPEELGALPQLPSQPTVILEIEELVVKVVDCPGLSELPLFQDEVPNFFQRKEPGLSPVLVTVQVYPPWLLHSPEAEKLGEQLPRVTAEPTFAPFKENW